jgi:hypothetical protein
MPKATELSEEVLAKLFTSALFNQQHGYVYLNRAQPGTMVCSNIAPPHITTKAVEGEDIIRVVESKLDLVKMWDPLLPVQELDRFCIRWGAIRSMNAKFVDHAAMRAGWLIDPDTGMRYVEKLVKKGDREEIEIRPCVWPVGAQQVWELTSRLSSTLSWVDRCPKQVVLPITTKTISYAGIAKFNLAEHDIGHGIQLPYSNNCGTNLFGYGRKVKLDHVDMHVGQDASIIRYYTTSEDAYAKVTCARPTMYFYSSRVITNGERV